MAHTYVTTAASQGGGAELRNARAHGTKTRLPAPPAAEPAAFGSALLFERPYPNANAVLLRGERPILVDPGFGAYADAMEAALAAQGCPATSLALVANTHFDCDHAGGNAHFQQRHGLPVAAGAFEAAMVNTRSPDACRTRYLRQHVEAYRVDRPLGPSDVLDAGGTRWTVLATPGHTRGHMAFWCEEERILVSGDALHDADLGWIDLYEEGPDSLDRAAETVERIAALHPAVLLPGHGPAGTDPQRAVDRARSRLRIWRERPEALAWHACKRVFAYALMLEDGMTEERAGEYLRDAPWFERHATGAFGTTVEAFIPTLIAEMLRGGSLRREDVRLLAAAPYEEPPPGWPRPWTRPDLWSPPPSA